MDSGMVLREREGLPLLFFVLVNTYKGGASPSHTILTHHTSPQAGKLILSPLFSGCRHAVTSAVQNARAAVQCCVQQASKSVRKRHCYSFPFFRKFHFGLFFQGKGPPWGSTSQTLQPRPPCFLSHLSFLHSHPEAM